MADELRVAREVMDEIREDLGWVTRNGIPGHRDDHIQLLRMARNPLASDANERLEARLIHGSASDSTDLTAGKFDELVSEITEIVTVVGQEQLNLLLSALDNARDRLLTAIKSPVANPRPRNKSTTNAQNRAESESPPTPSEHGRLF